MRVSERRVVAVPIIIIGLGCGLAVWNRPGRIFASEAETVTWGATDPTWSPDGARLAFSLFGSIWLVPSEGGQGTQLSSSPGYHAHPAWSPKGDKIAFVRGEPPDGPLPNIPGRLVLLDVETGRETEVRTPYPVAGTLAWSPDGARIVCALRPSNYGALLYDINLADGTARALQEYNWTPGHRGGSQWVNAAWHPKRNGNLQSVSQAGIFFTEVPNQKARIGND